MTQHETPLYVAKAAGLRGSGIASSIMLLGIPVVSIVVALVLSEDVVRWGAFGVSTSLLTAVWSWAFTVRAWEIYADRIRSIKPLMGRVIGFDKNLTFEPVRGLQRHLPYGANGLTIWESGPRLFGYAAQTVIYVENRDAFLAAANEALERYRAAHPKPRAL